MRSRIGYLLLVALSAPSPAFSAGPYLQNPLAGSYTDSRYFTDMTFGTNSQWIMPWRSYLQTQPASVFVDGLGVQFNVTAQNPDLLAQMLSKYGITHGRVEVGWGSLDYATASQVNGPLATANLQALSNWQMRPLILLNANSGGPCPSLSYQHLVTADAPAGTTTLQLDDVSNLIPGYSGVNTISSPSDPWMAEGLVTRISGNTIALSKPLRNAIPAGTSIAMATLKYKPLSTPRASVYNSADVSSTLSGWSNYVGVVAQWAATTLGVPPGSADMGFDLEVWNELTFGSHFLYLSDYYGQMPSTDANTIWAQVVQATAAAATASPALFSGVGISDGFANTVPWPASPLEPEPISSISKHPYTPRASYPSSQQPETMLNAQLNREPTPLFIPNYTLVQPEYGGTAIQTETLVRDIGPITNDIYGTLHGENARVINGQVTPVGVMITETGIRPVEVGVTDPTTALALKAKDALRKFAFYLNKGASSVFLYAAVGSNDTDFGVVQSNFVSYASNNTTYPANDVPYVSPLLKTLSNMVSQFTAQLDPTLTAANTRSLSVLGVSDDHNHYQFQGDGTLAHPNLYDRELFAFLPFQVNAKRFVVPYYVTTVDERTSLTPEYFTLTISGINGTNSTITVYDPINDTQVPVSVNQRSTNSVQLTLLTTDYPYLLIVQES